MKTWVYRLLTCAVMTAVGLGFVVCAASREVVLTVGFVSDSYWDAPLGNCYAVLDAAIDRFENKHPGVRVTYTSGILKEDYSEWLAGQYLLGKEPDVFMVLPEDFDMMQDFGALEPLDTRIERDSTVQAEDFYHAALDSGKMGNTQYALPYECVPTLMFVNKTLLEKNGISVPSNDWTWDDFYRICKQITRDTDGDDSIDQFGSYGYTWQNALTSNGAALFSDDGKQCLIAQPEAVEAIAFSQKLEKLYETCDITAQDFDTGHVAFRPFLFSDYRTYQPYPWRIKRYSGFEWDCIQMPAGPMGSNASELSTMLVSMDSRSLHKQLAWEFMKELTCSDETQAMLYTESNSVSALRRVTQSEKTKEVLAQDTPGEIHLGLDLLSDTMEHAVAVPRFQNYDQALLLAQQLIPAAMQDEHNLELQLLRAQRQLDKLLNN